MGGGCRLKYEGRLHIVKDMTSPLKPFVVSVHCAIIVSLCY